MKYADTRPYADPEKAARKLLEIASTIEPVQDGRIYIEMVNRHVSVQRWRQPGGISGRP